MKKNILVGALVTITALSLTSCGGDTYLEKETNQAVETAQKTGLSSAVAYQTQYAIDGLEKVMKDVDPTNLAPTIEKVKYEGTTISNVVSIAEGEGEGSKEIATKLKEIDTRLKALTSKADIAPAEFVTGVDAVVTSLKELLK